MTYIKLLADETVTLVYKGPKSFDLKSISMLVFGTLGALSVIVIILAGIRMILSGGNPDSINTSKNTIIYAAIGLAIAVSAMAIIQLITSWL